MNRKVLETIRRYNMIESGCKVVAALSGGADSIAMTHCLYTLSKELGFTLTACHINHTLRGEESERDYRFVESFCKEFSIPLVVFREDINAFAKKTSQSIETAARDRRYLRFSQCADKSCDRIATAHTLSDSAETMIYNIIRGSGIKGLGAIPPVRDNIIRPLIDCTREEVEEYCRENGLSFVTDSTNLTDDYTRNKIRHNVMPFLKEICPSALSNMKKLMESAREDSDCLEKMASDGVFKDEKGRYNADIINSKPEAVRKRVIINILNDFGFEVSSARVNEVSKGVLSGNFKAQYAKGKYICCKNSKVFCLNDDDEENIQESFFTYIDTDTDYIVADKKIKVTVYNREAFENLRNNNKIDLKKFIDYDKITGKVYLRQKRDGDSVKLWKRSGTKSLKKLFNEAKLTKLQKSRTLLLCDDCGVIWVENFGGAERVHADKNTENILLIESVDMTEEKSNEK